MKKILISLILCAALAISASAQAPQQFNYQAVARDNAGALLKNQPIGLRITIEDDNATALYIETHTVTTNSFGLFTLAIGTGTPTSGTLVGVNWAGGERYVKVDVDAAGGTNYTTAGTSQLLSVPYALYAENSGNGGDSDATNELQELTFNATTGELTLSNGNTITLPLATGGDNWGSQTVATNNTLTGNGTSSSPLAVNGVLTDNQTLTVTGSDLAISGGNSVSLSGINTDAQTLSLSGNTLAISGGNSVTLPAATGGDNWGSQTVAHNNTLTGNGTTASPLAVNGVLTDNQTLSLSGSDLTIAGGNTITLPLGAGGDNWGTQVVQHNNTLTGSGTSSSPLAVNGVLTDNQTLSLSGSTLSIAGGNNVNLAGAGLPLGTNGATLRHNGSGWLADSSIFSNGTFVGMGTTQSIGAARLVVSSPALGGYNGMYINIAGAGGYPFYGYATSGIARAWTYYDGSDNAWHLNENSINRFTVKDGNFGINNTDPTKRLDVNGSLRFNTGTIATGKVLVGTASDGSADWAEIGDAGIADMERSFFIPADAFSENDGFTTVTRSSRCLLYNNVGNEGASTVFSLPSDYASGLIYLDIYFTKSTNTVGTSGFFLRAAALSLGDDITVDPGGPNQPLLNLTGNAGTLYKQTMTVTVSSATELISIYALQRYTTGTYTSILQFYGIRVRYTAKR